MRKEHLELLVCPRTGRPLTLEKKVLAQGRIKEGLLAEPASGLSYPIQGFIPRFVPARNYADNFGLEWNLHQRTQYDSTSGLTISRDRFQRITRWGWDLAGQRILEVGSGSGRFTAQALKTGALVASFDFSRAVEANYLSNGGHPNLLLVQADVYHLPFRQGFFDRAFSFGVWQHTPAPGLAFGSVAGHLRPGGRIASDVYKKGLLQTLLATKYFLRPFTRGLAPTNLYQGVRAYVDFMWPLVRVLRRWGRLGKALNWQLMVADHSGLFNGADESVLKDWAYLDTFDMLSPRYDHPQTLARFRRWHQEAGLTGIELQDGFNVIEGRAVKA